MEIINQNSFTNQISKTHTESSQIKEWDKQLPNKDFKNIKKIQTFPAILQMKKANDLDLTREDAKSHDTSDSIRDISRDKKENILTEELEKQLKSIFELNFSYFSSKTLRKMKFINYSNFQNTTMLKNNQKLMQTQYQTSTVFIKKLQSDSLNLIENSELRIHSQLVHSNVIKILGLTENPKKNKFLVLEKCDYTLFEFIINNRPCIKRKVLIVLEIINAISLLHSKGITYSCLNPSTIMINKFEQAVLSDFKHAIDQYTKNYPMNELNYCSSEQLLQEDFGIKSDIWSLGCLMYFIFTETHPFKEISKQDEESFIKHIIYERNFLNLSEGNMNKKIAKIIKSTLNLKPHKRPEIQTLYKKIQKIMKSINE